MMDNTQVANVIEQLRQERDTYKNEVDRLNKLIDTPHTDDWLDAVILEAAPLHCW